MPRHTIFTDVREAQTWMKSLAYLLDLKLRSVSMHPVKMTEELVEVQVVERMDKRNAVLVTVSFWVNPE